MKNIFIISTIVLVAGTLTAYLFDKIDFTTFGTVTTGISGIMFGLYQKWSKEEVIKANLKLEDEISNVKSKNLVERETIKYLHNEIKDLKDSISQNEIVILDEKPKKSRKR